ncbi:MULTISPECIES: two-component system response regulator [unclassified Oceanispirochaeta]|uniref:response regulator n=1 Tax=unclassified Oceanispirochaeta TaxID=2635722 RepID=UPI000E095463|nr:MULTISPECIES: response regulator [unclassified Oceanispirochaeta]MBF9016595.1 response regulator [Oceanispirochaeta sp. M2]NPD73058.1 response regulator [Oceanispirochaeta sp. M1]RDG31403.1 response regulator [Oceanispirochaeta sp. M1]
MISEELKILIVDDREENLFALEMLLHEMDVTVIRTESGNDALKATLEHDFALALIDVQMPEMDGFETVKLMRLNKRTELLPVIFVSAIYSDEFYHVKGIESGAVDFLVKPLNPSILKGKVSVFLKLYKQRRELEKALENVEALQGLLPICSHCKSIRDDKGYWSKLENYFLDHSDILFSHSLCPDCFKKHYPEIADKE